MKSALDVLVVGGYGITDKADGGDTVRDRIRLTHKNQPVSLGFIKHFVESGGVLSDAERRSLGDPLLRQFPRQLNTIYLYDYLKRQGFETAGVSYFAFERTKFDSLMALKPKVLALSTTFISDPTEASEIARAAKDISPETVVIAGGIKVLKSYKQMQLSQQGYFDGIDPHELAANAFFYSPTADAGIDAFVIEESGEQTLTKIIRNTKAAIGYRHLPNLAYYNCDQIVFTTRQKEPCHLESHAIDWNNIPADLIGNEIPVRAGIGCPFKCAFCDFAGLHEKMALRGIESIMAELTRIQSVFPGKPIFFTDDNLFISKPRTRKFLKTIIDSGLKFPWRAFFRVDSVDDEIAALAAESGCRMALLGVESGDPRILGNMNKRITPEQSIECVSRLHANGVSSISTIIVGFPGETKNSVSNTINMLNTYPTQQRSLMLYYPFVFFLTPLNQASSPQLREKFNIKGLWFDWSHSTMDVNEAQDELIRLVNEVHKPILHYPEMLANSINPFISTQLMQAREQLVRDGITTLNNENAQQVFNRFKPILAPDTACTSRSEYRATA